MPPLWAMWYVAIFVALCLVRDCEGIVIIILNYFIITGERWFDGQKGRRVRFA